MPGFSAADIVMPLFRRVNSAGLQHPLGKAKTEAFYAREGVKTP